MTWWETYVIVLKASKTRRSGSSVGIATGYGLDGPGIESRRGEIFRISSDRPRGPPSLLYNGYRVFPWVKSGRGVRLTLHPLLVPWSRKSRAIPLLPLWAVRPVQSLSACTVVTFTLPQCLYKGDLYLTSVPVQGCTLPYLSACTRMTFTLPQCLYKVDLYLTSVAVQGWPLPYLSACTRVHFTLP